MRRKGQRLKPNKRVQWKINNMKIKKKKTSKCNENERKASSVLASFR